MKIQHIEVWPVTCKLAEPYTIAYETYDSAEIVFIRIETSTGINGFGCCSPDPEVTGETADRVFQLLANELADELAGLPADRLAVPLTKISRYRISSPGAVAAIDMALFDIWGKMCGQPVYRLLGGFRTEIATSITIGILPEAETLDKARDFIRQGFHILKLKGGLNVADDIARVCRTREIIGREAAIRFDANQGYSVAEALEFSRGIENMNIEFIEQPTPQDDFQALAAVSAQSNVPIMADESLKSPQDAVKIAAGKAADLLNIKLMKSGGISGAMGINAIAAEFR
jgi:L-alanine-DL-glutamate epimerase-like enolase superfamily enzyme